MLSHMPAQRSTERKRDVLQNALPVSVLLFSDVITLIAEACRISLSKEPFLQETFVISRIIQIIYPCTVSLCPRFSA